MALLSRVPFKFCNVASSIGFLFLLHLFCIEVICGLEFLLQENGTLPHTPMSLKGMDECAGFEFFSNFDSANLAKVEYVPPNESVDLQIAVTPASNTGRSVVPEIPDVEFNIWTKPDACGTEFENGYRTWFYFGIRANSPGLLVKLNMIDLNRQAKMYSQGMAPVYRIIPGKLNWERVRDKPTYSVQDNIFTLSFKYRTPENIQSITYFAFTYPFSYTELTNMLGNIDSRFTDMVIESKDDIYYHRELVCVSIEGRRVDLITVSSYHNISDERETRLQNLFPELEVPRSFRFIGKKIIIVSARVHPGETPSSFAFNGFFNLILSRDDPVGITLRRLYVFKLIPMLNPDGVAKGHYRTDTRGVNLNRVYLNPSLTHHPSIYAARALIRYYHYGYEKEDTQFENINERDDEEEGSSAEDNRPGLSNDNKLTKKVSHMTLEENKKNQVSKTDSWCSKCKTSILKLEDTMPGISNIMPTFNHTNPLSTGKNECRNCGTDVNKTTTGTELIGEGGANTKGELGDFNSNESGLYMYMDMHGHASKKGIFMYGNHFEDLQNNIECMLLAKIMSLNNFNFHFTACNFSERNMYLRDKRDGMSKEGSGRVAVLKLTGLVKSYTLECNYNTGRYVNALPSTIRESSKASHTIPMPPKYTPHVFEDVGRAFAVSILDLTGQNPITRLPNSQFHTLNGIREWLRIHCINELGETRCAPARFKLRNTASLHAQGKSVRAVLVKARSASVKGPKRIMSKSKAMRSTSVPIERKENIYETGDTLLSQPSCSKTLSVPRSRPKSYSSMKSKVQKEGTLKQKGNTVSEKSKSNTNIRSLQSTSCAPRQKLTISSKLQTIKEKQTKSKSDESDDSGRVRLKEICFIKSSEGKRMIAKYKTKEESKGGSEDNLIVAWDARNTNPQVFSHKTKGPGIQDLKPLPCAAPGPSRGGVFRVHNFAKSAIPSFAKSTSTKIKRNKRPLRRLASGTDVPGKTEKLKKRKVLKSHTT